MQWINSINVKSGSADPVSYDIGATFENVHLKDGDIIYKYSLLDFFKMVKDFFAQPMHMIYSEDAPSNQKIVEWYQIS